MANSTFNDRLPKRKKEIHKEIEGIKNTINEPQ
jgi:hypothetical protein